MSRKYINRDTEITLKMRREYEDAYDFDPKDPMFGLSRQQICGPQLERRTVLRLMAAAGTLTAMQLMPATRLISEASAAPGGTLNCGWAGVGEFRTFDPARIAQVLLFQISSNVFSGLTHINPQLVAQGDMSRKYTNRDADIAQKMRREYEDAYDFDPKDPMFGLSRQQICGPQLERRTVLRLMAAAGTLTAMQLMPATRLISEASAAPGGTLNCGWAGVGEFRTFDPARIAQVLLFQISSNVFSGLTHINPQLVAQGDMAIDWTVNDAGTEYIFNLREGASFHNGDKFTADDVVYTYNRSKDPKKSIHGRVIKNVVSVERLSDYKVKITLKAPQASFLTKALERSSGRAMTLVSRGAIEQMGDAKYGLMPVGTGPFRITDHKQGQSVTLERFDKYYDPERPKLDKVVITPIVDVEPLAAAMEAGDISLIGGNPVAPELVGRR